MALHEVFASLCVSEATAAIDSRAVAAGARLGRPASEAFYGKRSGSVLDPFGHRWLIGHSIQTLAPRGMQRRYDALLQAQGSGR